MNKKERKRFESPPLCGVVVVGGEWVERGWMASSGTARTEIVSWC